MKRNSVFIISIVIIFFIGFSMGKLLNGSRSPKESKTKQASVYTCSMHPNVKLTDPNAKCPLCGMDLIPVGSAENNKINNNEIVISRRGQKLAEILVVPVERKFVATEIRMSGKIEFDETRIVQVSTRVPGRLDRLFVDYVGTKVRKGDHLVEIYSPDLISAQEELLQSIETTEKLINSSSEFIKNHSQKNVHSARDKLKLWGLSDNQIEEIESSKKIKNHITIFSPLSGITIEKNAIEGMYVSTGTSIYKIADLTSLWVKLDAYESDLPWIHYGQKVQFRTEAYPGEIFTGIVAFIDPILNDRTRTVKVRVNIPNQDLRLKPDMFVKALVQSNVAKDGKIMDPGLAGKWISPMHPEIVKDQPGDCDVCGMPLVSAESLGYVTPESSKEKAPLVIPSTAPLITGRRAVVYVEKKPGSYEGREVVLGARASDFYIVKSGLSEGEKVVVNGSFKIDSAVQILGKPSMMAPPESELTHKLEKLPPLTLSHSQLSELKELILHYSKMQKALSLDNFKEAQKSATEFAKHTKTLKSNSLDASDEWRTIWKELTQRIENFQSAQNIKTARDEFLHISNSVINISDGAGGIKDTQIWIYHCPMAFSGKGGHWIQTEKGTTNPYYGSLMYECGSLKYSIGAIGHGE